MKLTKLRLKQIIKEELQQLMEGGDPNCYGDGACNRVCVDILGCWKKAAGKEGGTFHTKNCKKHPQVTNAHDKAAQIEAWTQACEERKDAAYKASEPG